MDLPADEFIQWLTKEGLISEQMQCPACLSTCTLQKRSENIDQVCWRCCTAKAHEISVQFESIPFFERAHFTIQDIMLFIKQYVDGVTLLEARRQAGISYQKSGVDWASFIRGLFKEDLYRSLPHIRLSGEVEIDESLFGRRTKYHRGRPQGAKVWIFGTVERGSNTLVMYSVENGTKETLVAIIQKHVATGSQIFQHYSTLNSLGYQHFTVTHKSTFKRTYRNVDTGELKEVHTNNIECVWKHAKRQTPNATLRKCLERCFPSLRVTWPRHCGETKPGQTSTTSSFNCCVQYICYKPLRRCTPTPPHYSPRGPPGRVQKILTEAWSSKQPMTWSKKMGLMNPEMMLKQLLKRYVKLYSWQSYSDATAYFSSQPNI